MNTTLYPPEIRAATMQVVRYIRALGKQEIQPHRYDVGLCWELFRMPEYVDCEIPGTLMRALRYSAKQASFTWPHWSGYKSYPVPAPDTTPQYAFESRPDLWLNDEYGDMRRRYCLHVANYLEGCLNNGRLYDAIA